MQPPTPLKIPLYYDFASSLCYVTHRVLERMAEDLFMLNLDFEWKPIDLAQLLGWRRGVPIPADRARNVQRVCRELEVSLQMPTTWQDSRPAAAIAIAMGRGSQEQAFRERVFQAVYAEGRFDALGPGIESLLPQTGSRPTTEQLADAESELQRLTGEARELMVTGVPTFMLETWPFGGIQTPATMLSILRRFASKQRESASETLH